jgi:His-Xaa-Ser system radical SAM maturase HxsC
MIPLGAHGKVYQLHQPVIGRITRRAVESAKDDHVRLLSDVGDHEDLRGYAGLLLTAALPEKTHALNGVPTIHSVGGEHLDDGDVVSLDTRGYVRTLYRRASPHNSIFMTDQCNSYCIMCSQPPKRVDDSWRVSANLRLVRLMDPETREIGITGGEPTILGDGLVEVLRACKQHVPNAAVHILSNGRLCDDRLCARLAAVDHPDLMIGVPIYSDLDYEHDFVVQAKGGFDEAMRGLQNLGRHGIAVEVRVVIHRETYRRLPRLAEFIYRNLTFASHVALMGLEMKGFAISNIDSVWIDPFEYRNELTEATMFLASRGMSVSIYNHQLCTVPAAVWRFCRRSISDWKNDYLPACDSCAVRTECGGFFSSGLARRYSEHIHPIAPVGQA